MRYLKLNNNKELSFCDYYLTNESCVITFFNTPINDVEQFFGENVIHNLYITDSTSEITKKVSLGMKLVNIKYENGYTINRRYEVVSEPYYEEIKLINQTTGEPLLDHGGKQLIQMIYHPANIQSIDDKVYGKITTAYLQKPNIFEQINTINSNLGIEINTDEFTLDEYKEYQKSIIGKCCTKIIENGVNVETSLGIKHFSYTTKDQSNLHDIVMGLISSSEMSEFSYHADGEQYELYTRNDIIKIYSDLYLNKIYHKTYCNVLNKIISECVDISDVQNVNYGMAVESYNTYIQTVTNNEKALLENMFVGK